MFGSKLRSWMENHIVRGRKRGNKNKNNACNETNKKDANNHQNNSVTTLAGNSTNTANGHYGNNNGSNNITSPVRRREVSPIQNHSRYGWQSPDSETITSPKSDNFLYAPQQRVRHQQCKDLQTTKEIKSANNAYHYQQQQQQYQQQQIQNNSSSSFSSLSWSTGSKEPISHVAYNEHSKVISDRHQCLPTPIITFHGPNDTNYDDENADTVHYEEIQTILRQPSNLHNNGTNYQQERPKSEQLTSFAPAYRHHEIANNYAKDDTASARYGKLLPSRMPPVGMGTANGYNDNLQAARPLLMVGSAESLPCNNYQTAQTIGDLNGPHNNWQNRVGSGIGRHNQHYNSSKGNVTTTNGVSNGGGGGTIPLHALSSPESAYSTGYSTDGTSPGACHNHPPEYYINMRTGTHYFPKSVNSLAIEAQRYKFGLNKIEEMSPIDPLPNVSFAAATNKISNSSFYISPKHTYAASQSSDCQEKRSVGCHSPLVLRNAIMLPTLDGFESSSPRQRCRIRTNPWYSTGDAMSTGMPSTTSSSSIGGMPLKQTVSTSATSSTLSSSKSSTSTFGQSNILTSSTKGRNSSNSGCEMLNYNANKDIYDSYSSDEHTEDGKHSTLSLTEVQTRQRATSNSTFRIKRANKGEMSALKMPLYALNGGVGIGCVSVGGATAATICSGVGVVAMAPVVSDEDATLNEMMGKFDESYVYEKETDILSDSDATNCPSELDTGLDAEDECDTDELLDIDFIDTSSMKEVLHDKREFCFNGGNSTTPLRFSNQHETTTRMSRRNRHSQDLRAADSSDSKQQPLNRRSGSSGSHRRRKRLIKTRKKNASECKENVQSGSPLQRSRETRSVGGTPISLRRNPTVSKERLKKASPMPARASSLIFHHDPLMKADLEADVKYRQLIEEAESILVSLKSSTQTIPRETPVSSPRRLNPLVNKRIEMLKSFEGARPLQPQQQQIQTRTTEMDADLNAALNKRIELLKTESLSVPNSPKSAPRFSPSKTHITNFINQIDGQRKPVAHNSSSENYGRISRSSNANEARLSRSPTPTSPLKTLVPAKKNDIGDCTGAVMITAISDFESDLELENNELKFLTYNAKTAQKLDLANHNCLPEITRVLLRGNGATLDDFRNHNASGSGGGANGNNEYNKLAMPRFCPQSEPLKRKVYKGSNTFERLKFSIDLELGGSSMRYGQVGNTTVSAAQPTLSNASSQDLSFSQLNSFNKKQLLLDTLSDLKQNLENQSVELNGLNAN